MTKSITLNLTPEQAEVLDGVLKAAIFNKGLFIERRKTPKVLKEVYVEDVKLLTAVVEQLAQ